MVQERDDGVDYENQYGKQANFTWQLHRCSKKKNFTLNKSQTPSITQLSVHHRRQPVKKVVLALHCHNHHSLRYHINTVRYRFNPNDTTYSYNESHYLRLAL